MLGTKIYSSKNSSFGNITHNSCPFFTRQCRLFLIPILYELSRSSVVVNSLWRWSEPYGLEKSQGAVL